MDIENMHPFCLPFSLCHDAASSTGIADESAKGDKLGTGNHLNNNNNNNNTERNRSRSKGALSPLDDIFEQLDCNRLSPPSNRLLLQDECLVDSSDHQMDHDGSGAFHALHLDIDMMATEEEEDADRSHDDTFNLCEHHRDDDWFSSSNSAAHDCLLFSPPADSLTNATIRQRKSHADRYAPTTHPFSPLNHHPNHHHHHHQVFHIVDPITIKSSPTLAQLNLNSNHDDPTDGLWDTTSSSTSMATSSNGTNKHHTSNTTTAPSTTTSNSTSIISCSALQPPTPGMLAAASDLLPTSCLATHPTTCNHNLQQHSTSHQNHHLHNQSPMCNHHMFHHHHHHHQNLNQHLHHHHQHLHQAINGRSQPSHAHGNCSALTSLRKNPELHHSGWCGAQRVHCAGGDSSTQASETSTPLTRPQQAGEPSKASNGQQSSDPLASHQPSKATRCASPAPLVTSSSSPLSSSSGGAQNSLPDQRLSDNKLKENIEYLTVLLCNGNGNKLDKQTGMQQPQPQQQQQNISTSTMAKSYSTLVQTLSAEPKLLPLDNHHHQQPTTMQTSTYNHHQSPQANVMVANNQQQQQPHQQNMFCGGMNTAWSSNEVTSQSLNHLHNNNKNHHLQHSQQMSQNSDVQMLAQQQDNGLKRAVIGQWFSPNTVESSISAADSTAGENHNATSSQSLAARCNGFPQARTNSPLSNSRPGGEMKVLSSLLKSDTCARPAQDQATTLFANNNTHGPNNTCAAWSHGGLMMNQNEVQRHLMPVNGGHVGYPPMSQIQQQQPQTVSDGNSIPPNGRPITLTPVMSHNVIIPQRHQTQSPKAAKAATKAPTFAQPASPSASSTTSSSGITEIGNAPQTPTAASKRQQKPPINNNNNGQMSKSSDRSGRPNSFSTECSLSSHDEGFSSQVDQDDCMNSMREDSDDDSDLDSDDESFYGDYTNNDLIGASISDNPDCKWTLSMGRTRRNGQRRFFWQYNVQSKGPKGARVASADGSEDPFVLPEASDPVFSNDCQIEGVKHSGKARRGDGNDLTPNPRKLLMIGLELKKLSKIINELAPVTDLPLNARNKTRKEKNKLASRACRLKKKAQHEANKIKLFGLQREHQQMVTAIYDIRKMLRESLATTGTHMNASNTVRTIIEQCSISVAGKTSDFVNSVLEKVVSGFIDGGLQT